MRTQSLKDSMLKPVFHRWGSPIIYLSTTTRSKCPLFCSSAGFFQDAFRTPLSQPSLCLCSHSLDTQGHKENVGCGHSSTQSPLLVQIVLVHRPIASVHIASESSHRSARYMLSESRTNYPSKPNIFTSDRLEVWCLNTTDRDCSAQVQENSKVEQEALLRQDQSTVQSGKVFPSGLHHIVSSL